MTLPASRYAAFVVGFCAILEPGSTRAVSEKVPHDKVIHPLFKGVVQPALIPESRKDPVYPEPWREVHLGARVILQGVIKKSGTVREITPIKTDLWVEKGCGKESGDSTEKQPAPPEAAHDFEVAAAKAVKQWRYRPGEMNDVAVDVYYTIVVEFTPCPEEPGKEAGP